MEKRLEEIKNRVKDAISGPWGYDVEVIDELRHEIVVYFNADEYAVLKCYSDTDALNTALFIAEAREDIPFLLEEIERLRKRIKWLEERECPQCGYEFDVTEE